MSRDIRFSEYSTDYISGVMSLRKPQQTALEILDSIVNGIELDKNIDQDAFKQFIHSNYPLFTEFDRAFPSLTFALATGVGKTRLMGTFITYLYTNKGIKNFLVIAPSLTIYNKLINDLGNPSSPKYVFKGVGCFTFGPNIIVGEDYRESEIDSLFGEINIFIYNAQKLNSDDENRRVNAFNENLGMSFFNYLKSKDDLVILMDEAHHYRNNSAANAFDTIRPVLGLELTATPFMSVRGKMVPFNNVVQQYSLALSIKDGYTRTPYVLTRRNVEAFRWGDEELDQMMIKDGLYWHQSMKVKLRQYAEDNHVNVVKPFVLIVCQNIDHATTVLNFIKSKECFDGIYADKVIEIDSGTRGNTEDDRNIQLLLNVEKPDNPVEIIVHVNMLKEGWDVNNLYTIIPLRSAYSRTLVEQTIGRGLRLPYGKRTGNKDVDSVTMTAHTNFERIINDARSGNSIFRAENIIHVEDIDRPTEVRIQTRLDINISEENQSSAVDQAFKEHNVERTRENEIVVEQIQTIVRDVVQNNINNGRIDDTNYIQSRVVERINTETDIAERSNDLPEDFLQRIFGQSIDEYVRVVQNNTIAIPKIATKFQNEEATFVFDGFDLDLSKFTSYGPVSNDMIVSNVVNPMDRYYEKAYEIDFSSTNPARIIITLLRDKPEIDYDNISTLIIKLLKQYFDYLQNDRGYSDNQLRNVVVTNKYRISEEFYTQLMAHRRVKNASTLEEYVSNISYEIKRPIFTSDQIANAYELFYDLPTGIDIKTVVFKGGSKWMTEYYKFDSNSEKKFTILCENDPNVIHWLRPVNNQFDLYYEYQGQTHTYYPDLVVETNDAIYLVEVKRRDELEDEQVLAKKKRGVSYCKLASDKCRELGLKEWTYLLVPHDAFSTTTPFEEIVRNFKVEN